MRSTPQSPKAIDGAASAYLAKCAQIADPEVARFGQLSPTRLLKAQQAKIPHEKSKGLRAGSNPSKRGLIIRGMFRPPDRPSRGLVLRSEDAKESTMIDIRHLGAAPDDIERDFHAAALVRTLPGLSGAGKRCPFSGRWRPAAWRWSPHFEPLLSWRRFE